MTSIGKTPASRASPATTVRYPTGSGARPGRELSSAISSVAPSVSADQRRTMICEAAYYIAERRGFEAGHELDDWLLAEKQVEAVLTAK